jgi:hypothetical protein
MEGKSDNGEQKKASRLEFGKAAFGCISAVAVACISGTVALVTNWETVQKFLGSFSTSSTLFTDEFSNPDSGWDRYRDETTGNITDYENGSYRIYVNEPNTDLFSNPGKSYSDVIIKATVQYLGGPEDNIFGVLCRYQDVDNYYELVLSNDGYYGIGRTVGGQFNWLGTEKMQVSDAIHTGGATNIIQAECKKDTLVLSANGHQLMSVRDTDLPDSGDIGLIAGSGDEAGVDISFDHLTVKKP